MSDEQTWTTIEEPGPDGRIRLRCKRCGEVGPAVYRYFPDGAHLAKNYSDALIRMFFEDHAECFEPGDGRPELEFVAD